MTDDIRAEVQRLDTRLGAVEMTLARQDERERRIEHDTKNIRQLFTGMEARFDARNDALNLKIDTKLDAVKEQSNLKIDTMQDKFENKLNAISRNLLTIGVSIVGSLMMILIAIVGYFLMQKDQSIEQARDRTAQMQQLQSTTNAIHKDTAP